MEAQATGLQRRHAVKKHRPKQKEEKFIRKIHGNEPANGIDWKTGLMGLMERKKIVDVALHFHDMENLLSLCMRVWSLDLKMLVLD